MDPKKIANALLNEAVRSMTINPKSPHFKKVTPFSKAYTEAKNKTLEGGKPDDISICVGIVSLTDDR